MTIGRPNFDSETGEAGFTLVEMVVALALLALIMALLAGSINIARRVLATIETNNAANSVVAAQNYLRATFAQAFPLAPEDTAEGRVPSFAGGPANVRFATTHVPRGQVEGVYRVEIGLEPSTVRNRAFDLVVTQTMIRNAPSDGESSPVLSRRSTLVPNIQRVSFSYYGVVGDAEDQFQWQTFWSKPDRLPRLVRIDVTFGAGDPRIWLRLQVPLHLSDAMTAR